MKKILLPTDFSDNSRNAISYALNFYKNDNCEFNVLHSYHIGDYLKERKTALEKQNLEKKLSILMQEIKMRYPNPKHTFKTILQDQPLIEMLNNQVENNSFEVIILGSQGADNSKKNTYGANTIHMMEDVINCPLLAIPAHVKFSEIKEIVLATGFKTTPKPREYDFIKELLHKTKSKLRILYIQENGGLTSKQQNNKSQLFNLLKEVNYTFHTLAHVTVPIGIYCFTESRLSDMIIFINKKYKFFRNVLFDPLYKDVGNYSKIPVLIIQTSEENLS